MKNFEIRDSEMRSEDFLLQMNSVMRSTEFHLNFHLVMNFAY